MNPPPSVAGASAEALRHASDLAWLIEALVVVEPSRPSPPAALALQPVSELLARIDNRQQALRCIHVGGSKGTGSTVLLCEEILGAAGLRTGSYTSPHLQRYSERYRVGGREVGLGGRRGPTNVISPLVSCITSIELELTDCPGTTRAAIAGEKAGIIKTRGASRDRRPVDEFHAHNAVPSRQVELPPCLHSGARAPIAPNPPLSLTAQGQQVGQCGHR